MAFGDIPTPAIACQLVEQYPSALFVLKLRNITEWVDSFSYMLCRWTAHELCTEPPSSIEAFDFHMWAYGSLFIDFCMHHKPYCANELASRELLEPQMKAYYENHVSRMMSCLPPQRRLIYNLESDANSIAAALTKAMGCSPPIKASSIMSSRIPAQEQQKNKDLVP
jgi:hypothetical protein